MPKTQELTRGQKAWITRRANIEADLAAQHERRTAGNAVAAARVAADMRKGKAIKKTRKAKITPGTIDNGCLCGCGRMPKGTKSRFMPGHDAKINPLTGRRYNGR